jgi:nucleoside-diphosphate-sugar epimerase
VFIKPVEVKAFRLVQMSKGLTVVITGASGFLGRHVVEEIRKSNQSIIAICRSSINTPPNLQREEIASVDSNSTVQDFVTFFEKIDGPVVLVHLAAHYSNLHSEGDVSNLIESNIHFPTRLIDALARAKPNSTVINISTLFQHFESREYSPLSLYGATKESFLKILDFYAESESLKVADITIGDTYGANDVRRKLIDLLISHVGSTSTLRLGSGRQNMSLMHITDVARGISQVIEDHQSIPSREVWRVQMQPTENISVRELVARIERISGKSMCCTFDASRDRKREIYAPIEGLKKLPNYEPLIDLETGLKSLLGK